MALFQCLILGKNVISVAPCGAGKSLIFQMGVFILKKVKDIPNGIGLCLEPLNNILSEKTSLGHSNQSAYITMTGENVKKGDSKICVKI